MLKNPRGIYGRNQNFANVQVLDRMDVAGSGFTEGDQEIFGDLVVHGSVSVDGAFITQVDTFAGTALTLDALSNGHWIYCTSGSAVTVTCPAGLQVGFSCKVIQAGAGKVSVSAGAGATFRSSTGINSANAQYSVLEILSPVQDVFFLAGDVETSYLKIE